MTSQDFRSLALSFPETSENTHMDHPDFRVAGKIFATLGYPEDGWAMVKLTPIEQEMFLKPQPAIFSPCTGDCGRRGATSRGLKILERDDYCCQYCGLDGRASFENALIMSVDFVVPRAHKGKKDPRNLVACCRPCNAIKGTRVYANLDDAKEHVLAHREELRKAWESKTARALARSAKA